MASTTDSNNSPIDIEDYKATGNFNAKWRTDKEFKKVQKRRTRFEEMKQWRKTSCPFPTPKDMISQEEFTAIMRGEVKGSYSWEDFWEHEQDLAIMKKQYIEGFPNVKSSIIHSRVETAQARFQKQNIGQMFKATDEDDEIKLAAIKEVYNHYGNISDLKDTKNTTFHESLILGNAFSKITRIQKVRDIEQIIVDKKKSKAEIERIMSSSNEDAKDKLKWRLSKGKPLTKKEKIIEYDDIARIPKSVWECFIDPDSRVLHGKVYGSNDFLDRTTPSIAGFKLIYENSVDPYVIKENVKKVTALDDSYAFYDGVKPLYDRPADIGHGSRKVELLEYYNEYSDCYDVIANDILIRTGPLPSNYKKIPYAHHKFIVIEHMFYGVGLPYVLEPNQIEDESTRNLFLHQFKLDSMPFMLYNSNSFGEEPPPTTFEPAQSYGVNGPVGPDTISWSRPSQFRADYYNLRNTFQEDATLASGVNSMSAALPQPNSPVRNNLMSQEATDIILMKGIENWAKGDRDATRQEIALMKQVYPETYKKPTKKGEPKKFKSIRMEGQKLTPVYENEGDEKNKKLIAFDITDHDGASFFEVKDEYWDLAGDIEVEFDTSSFPLASEALQLEKVKNFIDLMSQTFWIHPEMLEMPGAQESLTSYIRQLSPLGKDKILEAFRSESDDKSVERANEDIDTMLQGQIVAGKPGESAEHIMVETAALIDEFTKMADPATTPEQWKKLKDTSDLIMQHVMTDSQPKYKTMEAVTAMQQATAQLDPNMQQQPQQPMQPQQQAPMQDPSMMASDPSQQMGGPAQAQAPMGEQMPVQGMM